MALLVVTGYMALRDTSGHPDQLQSEKTRTSPASLVLPTSLETTSESNGTPPEIARIERDQSITNEGLAAQGKIMTRLIQRERDQAELIEVPPYPKMMAHIVAIPAMSAEYMAQITEQLDAIEGGDPQLDAQLKSCLSFSPDPNTPFELDAPSEPSKWRIIVLNLYGDELDEYRFRVIDTNREPETVFGFFSNGLLGVQRRAGDRVADLRLAEAKKRYGHLFEIENTHGDAEPPTSLLDKSRKRRLNQ